MANVDGVASTPPAAGADKEAVHRAAEAAIKPFAFQRPNNLPERAKGYCKLARGEIVSASVQIVPEGGENNLHYHSGEDGFWMVLQGKVKFYGPDGPIGEYGPNQGVLIPHHARYWFENADTSQELHLLHVSGRRRDNARIDVDPKTEQFKHARNYGVGETE